VRKTQSPDSRQGRREQDDPAPEERAEGPEAEIDAEEDNAMKSGNRRIASVTLKPFRECDCPCHKGGVVIHVVACCDGYIPGQTAQKPKPTPKNFN